ncbi:MAG: hypothetical protein JOZ74_10705 [Bradyrhizobium sp.]|nr:hypothetical protein [Bradyrhizobium sp.]
MYLRKGSRKRKSASPPKRRPAPPSEPPSEPPGEGGPEEAAAFIAESVGNLARLARRHRLDHLSYLLALAHLEAEEHLRLRSKRRLS